MNKRYEDTSTAGGNLKFMKAAPGLAFLKEVGVVKKDMMDDGDTNWCFPFTIDSAPDCGIFRNHNNGGKFLIKTW